jgi:hypothetical protein
MEEEGLQGERETHQPDGLLYHYTTQEGLLGILERKKIWASHLQYLNDASEGQIFTKLLRDEFKQRTAKGSKDTAQKFIAFSQLMGVLEGQPESKIQCAENKVLDWGLNAFSWINAQDTFVASFSEQGDLLSQWRAYSGETGGYSLGFPRSYLASVGMHFLESRKGVSTMIQIPL